MFIVMTFPMKTSVLDNFPLCPPAHPPLKDANFIFIVVSLSLSHKQISWSRNLLFMSTSLASSHNSKQARGASRASIQCIERPLLGSDKVALHLLH